MKAKIWIAVISLLVAGFTFASQTNAHSRQIDNLIDEITPENTVILSNAVDARFSQDFSVLLKQMRVEWVVLEDPEVPESIKGMNLILLGGLDSLITGEIMQSILGEEDVERIRSAEKGGIVLMRENPWMEGRRIYICAGSDLIQKRNAAEDAIRTILTRSPQPDAWIQTRFDAPLDADAQALVDQLRFVWEDDELPLENLRANMSRKPRLLISTQQAREDVERLFYLFSHGYAGYAYFNQQGAFAKAKTDILAEIETRPFWTSKAFSTLLYEHLGFIKDCHLNIGEYQYAGHQDFWYDTRLELLLGEAGYQFLTEDARYTLKSVNGKDPDEYLFPSLNAQGEPMYRLGVLSREDPDPLQVLALSDSGEGEKQLEISLQHSSFDYYAKEVFREDTLGGIPVLRVRSFADVNEQAMQQFVQTASVHRGKPVIVIDLRGNSGGNEAYPIRWIQGLTGYRAESVFIFSELKNKTTAAGRANLFTYLADLYPESQFFRTERDAHVLLTEAYESHSLEPNWEGPFYPQMPLIPNETMLVIVMNGSVASAGEGLVMRASQAENVMLVGENTQGCLSFGNGGYHLLPHSRLKITLPINFGLYLDLQSREEIGITPDLWVPAADAVNYAVAALRSGTITSFHPLASETLQQSFLPENPRARTQRQRTEELLFIGIVCAAGSIWVYFMRHKPLIVTLIGIIWLVFGGLWVSMGKIIGLGFLLLGLGSVVLGGYYLWKSRKNNSMQQPT